MSETPTTGFHHGQPVWVIDADGRQRPAEYVGPVQTTSWFGGPPRVYVVHPDTRSGEAVDADRVIPRDAPLPSPLRPGGKPSAASRGRPAR